MAKIHILDQVSPNVFNAVAHFVMPAVANTYGTTWKTAYLATFGSGAPTSVLKNSGNNNPPAGQIGSQEFNDIVAGNVVEVTFLYGDDPTLNATDRQGLMNFLADRAIQERKDSFTTRFSYYGYTQGVAS